jgi:predicted RNA-binding Zn-ribbon protein involved in translation (DUF1610 family)
MADYNCPDCGYTGEPEDVETAAIVDGVLVTCDDCGTTTIKDVAFSKAAREEHRAEVSE